jgi:sec-independent protein translocase protein TatC
MDVSAKPFLEHLDDLRKTLIWAGASLLVGVLVAIPLAPSVFALLKIPFERAELMVPLKVNEVGSGLSIALRVTWWTGLIFSLPFTLAAVGGFVFPGLTRREKMAIYGGGAASLGLFVLGIWMAYHWTVPVALRMMAAIENWMGTPADFWETAGYVSFVLKLLLAFGVTFQLPLLVYVLGVLGIINSREMRDKRRHVAVALLVVGMIMTPPDPFTMILMAAPLIALYELCIWLVYARE